MMVANCGTVSLKSIIYFTQSTEILFHNMVIQDFEKKQLAVLSFYKSGNIKSISLEQQTEISTPIGIFPAELVTFYEDGSINSLFPLNGQISGFWSEEEEGELAQKYHFSFPFGDFYAKIIGLRFYPDGRVRSLILWPNETNHN